MNRPAPVEITYESMRFLITHNPTNATLNKFTEELKKYGVTTLVRVCDATYDKAPVEKEGIQVLHDPQPLVPLKTSSVKTGCCHHSEMVLYCQLAEKMTCHYLKITFVYKNNED
ncbi:integrin alpha-E [Platysternon megacephalum]|uniref:Integrin alpha-E n=1 Tax=Platysternon megacephalum TaxID=55544 RepID=A0A4D9EW45_9SAUR|nr:integrin alpha-E [Platysternon megacephalum]